MKKQTPQLKCSLSFRGRSGRSGNSLCEKVDGADTTTKVPSKFVQEDSDVEVGVPKCDAANNKTCSVDLMEGVSEDEALEEENEYFTHWREKTKDSWKHMRVMNYTGFKFGVPLQTSLFAVDYLGYLANTGCDDLEVQISTYP